jgi:hypothetical protein
LMGMRSHLQAIGCNGIHEFSLHQYALYAYNRLRLKAFCRRQE